MHRHGLVLAVKLRVDWLIITVCVFWAKSSPFKRQKASQVDVGFTTGPARSSDGASKTGSLTRTNQLELLVSRESPVNKCKPGVQAKNGV